MKIRGFTLIEMLVAMAIVAVLAATAVPSYLYFVRKAHFTEIVQSADQFKGAVSACVERFDGNLSKCNAGSNDIPNNVTEPFGRVESITVERGIITITPITSDGIENTDTYVLQPTYISGSGIVWKTSGVACERGLVNCSETEGGS